MIKRPKFSKVAGIVGDIPGIDWEHKKENLSRSRSQFGGDEFVRESYQAVRDNIRISISHDNGYSWFSYSTMWDSHETENHPFQNYELTFFVDDKETASFKGSRVKAIYSRVKRSYEKAKKEVDSKDAELRIGKLEKFLEEER